MDLKKVRYFVTVVEAGSITGAARRLHLSQPPLSAAIMQLESDLGASLLERRSRGVTPTRAGELLYAHGRRLLDDADRLAREVGARGEGLTGSLRIGCEPLGHWNLVGRATTTFVTAYPDVDLTVVDAPPGDLVRYLRDHELDVAVVPAVAVPDVTALLGTGFRANRALSLPLTLCTARTEQPPEPTPVADLLDRTWILPRRIPGIPLIPEAMDSVFDEVGARPARTVEVSTPSTALPVVAMGLGVGVVAPGVLEHLNTIVELPVLGALPHLELAALWPADGIAQAATERFLRVLARWGGAKREAFDL